MKTAAAHDHDHTTGLDESGLRDRAKLLTASPEDAIVALAYARARKAAKLTQRQAAEAAGRARALVPQWEDPFDSASPALVLLWRHPPETLESLAEQRRALEPHDDMPLPPSLRGGRIAKESGDAVLALCCKAKSDEDTLQEIDEAIAELAAARRALLAKRAGR